MSCGLKNNNNLAHLWRTARCLQLLTPSSLSSARAHPFVDLHQLSSLHAREFFVANNKLIYRYFEEKPSIAIAINKKNTFVVDYFYSLKHIVFHRPYVQLCPSFVNAIRRGVLCVLTTYTCMTDI